MRRCACRHREARACMRAATHTLHSPHARRACARAARHVAHKCSSCGRHRRSPLRPRSTHTPAMPSDATGGWPCLHPPCVSSRAHHPESRTCHRAPRAALTAPGTPYLLCGPRGRGAGTSQRAPSLVARATGTRHLRRVWADAGRGHANAHVQQLPCSEVLQRRSPKDGFDKSRIGWESIDGATQGYLRSAQQVARGCKRRRGA
jgi:hypothetical protein